MKLTFKSRGEWRKTQRYLQHQRRSDARYKRILERYGAEGVVRLADATPRDSGETSASWYYQVTKTSRGYSLSFNNSVAAGSVPLVVLLQYGHGTRGGTYVQGTDFINPALVSVINNISESIWKEVTNG